MKPAAFRYHAPKTVDEAVALLAEVAPEDGRVLAGGQSLVPTMAFRLAKPGHLVDINGVAALNRLAVADGKLVIGACVRHAAFHRPVCEGPLGKLLADVVRHIAHYPIRNRGTFCGSLAHADPSSEWCLVLAALDGEVLAQERARRARHRGARFLQGHHDDGAARRRACWSKRDCRMLAGGHALRLLRVQPPRRRFRHGGGARRLSGRRRQDRRAARLRSAAPSPIRGASPKPSARSPAPLPATRRFAPRPRPRPPRSIAMEDVTTSAEFRRDLVLAVTRRALERAAA